MADAKPFLPTRPFLFVNYSTGSLDARPHRHAVFTHVQQSWKHWRKAEDAKAPKPSPRPLKKKNSPANQVRWKIPEYQDAQKKGRSLGSENDKERSAYLDGTQVNGVLSTLLPEADSMYRSKRISIQLVPDRSISPLSLVREGNSDPFNVFAIRINPQVNAMMKYTRSIYLPGIQGDLNNPGSPAVRREWAECVSFLQDGCLASAHLTRIASIVASDQDFLDRELTFERQALVLKPNTMKKRRGHLFKSMHDARACKTILMLLNAELYARNMEAAQYHAKILARLLQTGAVKTDPIFHFKVLYHDTQRAVMSLTRTSFDLEQWVPDTFDPIFVDPVLDQLPEDISSQKLTEDIDVTMDDFPVLKTIFATLKHILKLSLRGLKDPIYSILLIMMYGRITATVSMGRLINQYLDATEVLDDPYFQMQAYISLTTLLWMRAVSRIDDVKITGNTRIFAANGYIVDRLKDILANDITKAGHAKIKLWILFTSAYIEVSLGKATFRDSQLVNTFITQTRELDLHSWIEVKEILQGFLYTELLRPTESTWSQILDD